MPKRKRSGYAKSARAFKRRRYVRKVYRAKRSTTLAKRPSFKRTQTPSYILRPPFFRHLAPRVRTTHINKISDTISTGSPAWKAAGFRLWPARLRDPHNPTYKNPFPENFVTMAGLYRNYRVIGVHVTLAWHKFGTNENDKFFSTVYTTASSVGQTDPFSGVIDRATRDAFLQHGGPIRRRLIVSNGMSGNRLDTVHRVGYFSLTGIEQERRADMDDAQYAGSVTATGAAVQDPLKTPTIWITAVSPNVTGFPDNESYDVNIMLKFDVEWFNRRDSLETDQGDVDP